MGLIERIKSALGLGTSPSSSQSTPSATDGPSPGDSVDVTVEHEPDTASEDAVKGTDTADTGLTATVDSAAETGDADAAVDVPDAGASPGGDDADAGTASTADGGDGSTASETESTGSSPDADLEDIKGIGPTYAQRLRDAGIEGVAALAAADPEDVATETDIAASRVENWVEQAQFY